MGKQKVKNQPIVNQEQLEEQPNEPGEIRQEADSSQPGAMTPNQEPGQSQPRAEEIKHEADSSQQTNVENKQEAGLAHLRHGETKDTKEQAGASQKRKKEINQEIQPSHSEDEENKQKAGLFEPEDEPVDTTYTTDMNQLPMEGRISDAKVDDRYSAGKELGRGSYSVVLLGTEKETQKQYAVKKITLSGDPRGKDRFVSRRGEVGNEIMILMSLQHQNLISMKEYYEENNKAYLVTEFLSGGELLPAVTDLIDYSEGHARVCFSQILNGISYLHSQGITHRDIKSDNILLAGSQDLNHIKIIDFGVANLKTANHPMTTHVGSPLYTAPEMLSNRLNATYTSAVDLWSAGVLLFLLLGGRPPFDYTKHRDIYAAIKRAGFSFEAAPWKKISKNGKDLVSKLLVLDPEKRLSATEALRHPWFTDVTDGSRSNNRTLLLTRNALKSFLKSESRQI